MSTILKETSYCLYNGYICCRAWKLAYSSKILQTDLETLKWSFKKLKFILHVLKGAEAESWLFMVLVEYKKDKS